MDNEYIDKFFDPAEMASGIPMDAEEMGMSAKTEYMLKIEDLGPSVMKNYCPVWKEVQDAKLKDGTPRSLHEWMKHKTVMINAWSANKDQTPTHASMNNGSFKISFDDEPEFLKWYSIAASTNMKMWFVEQLTPVMRYFVDLDFLQLGGLTERQMEAAAFVVQRAIKKFYPCDEGPQHVYSAFGEKRTVDFEEALMVVVFTTSYKFILPKEDKPEMVKSGVHLIFPHLFVEPSDAQDMRETIMVELEKAFGKRVHPNNGWSDVVDGSVYGSEKKQKKGSGLRMPFSRKTEGCPACKGVKKKGAERCVRCMGNGRLDSGRAYMPLCVLDSTGSRFFSMEEVYRSNLLRCVNDTKVRTVFVEKPDSPLLIFPDHAPRRLQQHAKKSSPGRKSKAIVNSKPEWDALTTLIRGCGDGIYKDIAITQVTLSSKGQYKVHVTGDMCRYCNNIKREHNSNRIFFVVDASGIAQRCHDQETELTAEMKYGLCSSYSGIMGRIPEHLVAELFPHCPAAKTLDPMIATKENEDYDEEEMGLKITRDRKMRRLYEIGDSLSMSLWKVPWSSTLMTAGGSYVIAQQHIEQKRKDALAVRDHRYYALDPVALGSKGKQGMRELGYDEEDDKPAQEGMRENAKPLSWLEAKLFKSLHAGIELAAYSAIEELPAPDDMGGFDGLSTMVMLRGKEKEKIVGIRFL